MRRPGSRPQHTFSLALTDGGEMEGERDRKTGCERERRGRGEEGEGAAY